MISGLFGIKAGVDSSKALLAGIEARYGDQPPQALARLTVVVNTGRMQRRLQSLFDDGPARLLPRIVTMADLADLAGLPAAKAVLTRRLELAHLIAQAAAARPGFAEHAQRFALADSLAELLDEIEGEGVDPAKLAALEGPDLSEHWAETQAFIGIAATYQRALGGTSGQSGRLRQAVAALDAALPPDQPVVLAGSTGSRGAALDLMAGLLARDNAAVVLPGFDDSLTAEDWHAIAAAPNWEDHPQGRFVGLAQRMGWRADALVTHVQPWPADPPVAVAERRAWLSLALCPAPVSDQWLAKGPALGDPATAMQGVTVLEAASPRQEALAIALGLRAGIEAGKTVALISPDRVLTRRVTAQLARWDITPDDSAGVPLGLTPLGRLSRQIAELAKAPPDLAQILALLKHPLCASGTGRRDHNRATRLLELWLRKEGRALPGPEALTRWAEKHSLQAWMAWLHSTVLPVLPAQTGLADWVAAHQARLNAVIGGLAPDDSAADLWRSDEGQAVATLFTELQDAAEAAPEAAAMADPLDYRAFFEQAMQGRELRRPTQSRGDVAIWGTLEARAQGVDLAILAGLTEGVWPALPPADPWLNRALRRAAGLPAPERRVGLQAHDFQQAALAPEIWLCRPMRDDEADTIAARWLMRLTGLLDGLRATGGDAVLAAMRARGQAWLGMAQALEAPQPAPPAPRPCPAPPATHRPRQLSATDFQRLRRDPYAIYARRVLNLSPLNPLRPTPDAAARGIVMHAVFEHAMAGDVPPNPKDLAAHIVAVGRRVIAAETDWPSAELVWLARIARLAPSFAALEQTRPKTQSRHLEGMGKILTPHGVTISAKADRIDIDTLGQAWLIDYKTGEPPSERQRRQFDPQMAVMGWLLRQGAFAPPGQRPLGGMAFVRLGGEAVEKAVDLAEVDAFESNLGRLLTRMLDASTGFAARAMPKNQNDPGDYDHLARFGEWEMTDPAVVEDLR